MPTTVSYTLLSDTFFFSLQVFPTYMPACHLHLLGAVDVGQKAEAEALRVGRVGESIHRQGRLGGVEGLADPGVQLVVGDGAPEVGLLVGHRLEVAVLR